MTSSRRGFFIHLCTALPILLFLFAASAFSLDDPIQTDAGLISGIPHTENESIQVYKGVPFAAPPVGDLRWKAPQAAVQWEGIRACETFGSTAAQGSGRRSSGMSEDCLYLNIWTPATQSEDKLPVMVWIHGGGFTSGSGSAGWYNGRAFAERGVVLITINYRLGPFGFLAHPLLDQESGKNVSGNYGILDQIAALYWVQRNISAFGGDPDNVTIFGESAGGTSVYILCASPLAKGLFNRAIAESPWITDGAIAPLRKAARTRESVEDTGKRLVEAVMEGKSGDVLPALRAVSTQEILQKAKDGFRFPAAIDGYVLLDHPAQIFARGEQNNVALIAGTNRDEGTMFSRGSNFDSVEDYEKNRRAEYGGFASEILETYPVSSVDDIQGAVAQYITDTWFVHPTRGMVRGWDKISSTAYMYHFTRANPARPEIGATHAAEIRYVFNSSGVTAGDEVDKNLAHAMIAYWVQFAKTGDPNVEGLPDWPAYETKTDQHLVLDEVIAGDSHLRKDACDLLDRFFEVGPDEIAG